MTNETINISEVFGPTIQGEGIHTGVPSIFVRLNGCNLCCCFGNPENGITRSMCDTAYTSIHPDTVEPTLIDELANHVAADMANYTNPKNIHLVITGGEPLCQKEKLQKFITAFRNKSFPHNFPITIETNGSIDPGDLICHVNLWSVSPKLSSSCCFIGSQLPEGRREAHKKNRINLRALAEIILTGKYQLKFVYSGPECVNEIKKLVNDVCLYAYEHANEFGYRQSTVVMKTSDIDSHILLMPEGANREQLEVTSEAAAQAAIDNGWRYCDRTHIRVWNDKRAV